MNHKGLKLAIVAVLLVALLAGVFTACKPKGDKVTVTWYDGTKVLREDKVDKGTKVASWTPEVEGKQFMEWYSEASKSTVFDFGTVIDKDTDIFAGFKGAFVEDTREWYLVGTGTGSMKDSNWGSPEDPESLKLTKQEVEGKNLYKIENVIMYKGDIFQIRVKGTWDDQHGAGYLEGFVETRNEDDELIGDSKKDGVTYFIGGEDKFNKGTLKPCDTICDVDGIYTFVLETNVGASDYDVITYERTGDAPVIEETHDMYILGGMNEWKDVPEWQLTPDATKDVFTKMITITDEMCGEAGKVEFKVHNAINNTWFTNKEEDANMELTAGDWCVKYTKEGNKVEFQKLGYYVVGTFVDAEDNDVSFCVKEGVTPILTKGEDGVYTAECEAADVSGRPGYSWLANDGRGIFAIKVVYGCELGIRDWYSDDANGGDNFYATAAGTHTITLTIAEDGTGTVTVAPKPAA